MPNYANKRSKANWQLQPRRVRRQQLLTYTCYPEFPISALFARKAIHQPPFLCQAKTASGRAYSHRIPLAKLKCLSEKRLGELAAWLGGEPGGGRPVESGHAHRRSLL